MISLLQILINEAGMNKSSTIIQTPVDQSDDMKKLRDVLTLPDNVFGPRGDHKYKRSTRRTKVLGV